MLRQIVLVAGLVGMLVLGGVSLAQEATPVTPGEATTLDAVTGDSAAYYGQQVTLDGWLVEFVNANTFILGEGDPLLDSQVLVINNSGRPFSMDIVTGERVQVTGIVVPSFEEGGFDQVINNFRNAIMPGQNPVDTQPPMETTPMDETAVDVTPADSTDANVTPDTTTVIEATPAEGGDPMVATPLPSVDTPVDPSVVSPVSMNLTPLTNVVAERFSNYTILEITSLDSVMFIPQE